MRLLQRYILGELIKTFALLLTISTLLLVTVGVYEHVREYELGFWQILQILPFVFPSLLPFTIPAMLLLSICIVYGRMSGDREVIAAKAAGCPIHTLLWPSFLMGSVLSLVSLVVADQVLPWSMKNIEHLIVQFAEDLFLDRLRTRNQISFRSRGIAISVIDVEGRTLIRPTIRYSPKGNKTFTVQARTAQIHFDLPNDQVILSMEQGHIDLPDGSSIKFDFDERPFPMSNEKHKLKTRTLRIGDMQAEIQKADLKIRQAKVNQMVESSLILATGDFERYDAIEFNRHTYEQLHNADSIRRINSEMYHRIAISLGCFAFVLVGSPFSILMARRQFLTSFFFCFAPILVIYYPLLMMSQNLAKVGSLHPAYGAWIADGVLLVTGLFFLNRVSKN